jgi:hypothetical protein
MSPIYILSIASLLFVLREIWNLVLMLYPARCPGGERIVDVVLGGTELEPQVKTGSWAGHTHSQ